MVNINLLKSKKFDFYECMDSLDFISQRRAVIDDLVKNGDIPPPSGAVLLPVDRVFLDKPDPYKPRIGFPFVVGYQYYIKQESGMVKCYFLAAARLDGEEKLIVCKPNNPGQLWCLSKDEMHLPEESDGLNYG